MALDLGGRRAARLAKLMVDLMWWALVLLASIVMVVFLLSPLLVRDENAMTGMEVRVLGREDSPPQSELLTSSEPTILSPVTLTTRTATTHRLDFRTADWTTFVLVNWVFLPLIGAALLAIHLLRSMLKDVVAGAVFSRANAARLSLLGWVSIAIEPVGALLDYLRTSVVLARIPGDTLAPAPREWDAGGLLFGLLLLVLAAAWRYGAELQQERDLTV